MIRFISLTYTRSRIFALILLLVSLPVSLAGQALTADTLRTPSKVERTAVDLPREGLQLPATLDEQLEHLLQRWYEGYTKRQGATHRVANANVPNIPDSVYVSMLERIPSAIRLSYNAVVRESIELYLFKRKALVSSMLSLADLYFPEIEMELDRQGLPLELKYLTIVESSLNPSAFSPRGAAGLWQFMLPTARIYGLKINSLVDERLDPSKSTQAASKMFAELYRLYGDWWLAIAAYNCGAGNVNRAIKRSGKESPSFWEIYSFLPKETRRYIPLFIGAYFAMYYHRTYGIEPRKLGQPLATEHYMANSRLSFSQIAELTGLSQEEIKTYNPQYRQGIVPGNIEPTPVRLPIQAVLKLDSLTAHNQIASSEEIIDLAQPEGKPKGTVVPSTKSKRHKVRRGETLSTIARKYNTTVKKLRQWNALKSDRLKAGQSLVVSK